MRLEHTIEIWKCLNGMENSETWEQRRAHRSRLEQLLGIVQNGSPTTILETDALSLGEPGGGLRVDPVVAERD